MTLVLTIWVAIAVGRWLEIGHNKLSFVKTFALNGYILPWSFVRHFHFLPDREIVLMTLSTLGFHEVSAPYF